MDLSYDEAKEFEEDQLKLKQDSDIIEKCTELKRKKDTAAFTQLFNWWKQETAKGTPIVQYAERFKNAGGALSSAHQKLNDLNQYIARRSEYRDALEESVGTTKRLESIEQKKLDKLEEDDRTKTQEKSRLETVLDNGGKISRSYDTHLVAC